MSVTIQLTFKATHGHSDVADMIETAVCEIEAKEGHRIVRKQFLRLEWIQTVISHVRLMPASLAF